MHAELFISLQPTISTQSFPAVEAPSPFTPAAAMMRSLRAELPLVLVALALPFSLQEACDTTIGLKEKNRALSGYTFDSSNTGDSFSCAERCLDDQKCKSYNFAMSGTEQGLCELNSEGKDSSKPLQQKPGFVFVQIANRQVRSQLPDPIIMKLLSIPAFKPNDL